MSLGMLFYRLVQEMLVLTLIKVTLANFFYRHFGIIKCRYKSFLMINFLGYSTFYRDQGPALRLIRIQILDTNPDPGKSVEKIRIRDVVRFGEKIIWMLSFLDPDGWNILF